MTDITIDDLVGDDTDSGGGGGSADTSSAQDNAEWVGDLIDRLDEKGILDALLQQQMGMDPSATAEQPSGDGGGGSGVDADTVATFGKMVIDQMGDVPMSEVVKAAENNPDAVNQAINNALQEAHD